MRYVVKTAFEDIKDKYDCIIGWGTGTLLKRNYRKNQFKMDFIIDGRGVASKNEYQGVFIYGPEKLLEVTGKSLIIIYTIYEQEILNQIESLKVNADVIIYNLLEIKIGKKSLPLWNGKNADDIILLELAFRLGLEDISYLDIGVCHPVMRNNTYIFHELGYKGILVEPNPEFHQVIQTYRLDDKLLKIGVANEKSELIYYNFPEAPGLNTFAEEIGESRKNSGMKCLTQKILLEDINTIIKENFTSCPNILDIDVEGLDYQILESLDLGKYPIDIIMCECLADDYKLLELMSKKEYKVYAHTIENYIFVKK